VGLLSNLISFGAGYALGAQKGYEPIKDASRRAKSMISERMPRLVLSASDRVDVVDVREVREAMTSAPQTLDASAALPEAARLMRDHAIRDVVVTEGGRPTGIVTDRDIAMHVAAGMDPSWVQVRNLVKGDLVTIAPTETVQEATRRMRQANVRRLLVVEDDRVIGIASLGDLPRLPAAGRG
jgi:CBS domain-containing protein